MKLVAATSVVTWGLSAQVFTGMVATSGLGYTRPAPAVGLAVSGPRLDALIWAAPLRKVGLDNGYAAWGQVCVPIARGVGPALLTRYTRNSQWDRMAVYPSACYSGAVRGVRLVGMAHLPDVASVYRGYGGTVGVAVPLGRWTYRAGLTVLRFRAPSVGPFAGLSFTTGMTFRFARHRL